MKGHNRMGAQSPSGTAGHLDPRENTRDGCGASKDRPFPALTATANDGVNVPDQERTESAPDKDASTMDFSKRFA